jgi:Kef-type K+ transport system membrane component KefB
MNSDTLLAYVLLDVALVILLGRAFAVVLARIGQPPVLAEILAGIALGPTLFGAISPHAAATLFSPEATQMLAAIGGIGLVVFMFFVGLDLDHLTARRHRRTVTSISVGSLLTPLACGVLLGFSLYSSHGTVAGHQVPKAGFVLFISVAISITAFPVLARMLVDHDLDSTEMGMIAMASAAIQDLTGWLLLAVALAASAGDAPTAALWKAGVVVGLIAALFVLARPALRWMMARTGDLDGGETLQLAIVMPLVAACAGLTQVIGLHAVIGAFAVGVAFPRDCRASVIPSIRRALWPLTMSLLLPVYFLGPGLNFDLGSIAAGQSGQLLLIVGVACVAKFLGTAGGARTSGLTWRDSAVMGVLLNTRGLVELIILNVGFTEGVLDQTLYSQLVVMALVATFITSPVLRLAVRGSRSPLFELTVGRGAALRENAR